jgi:hypothetical protein
MDARLLPEFAYSANPYLVAQNAEWITSWGYPSLFVPAAPFGFAGTPPTLGFQYVSGLPIFQYQPTSFFNALNAIQGGVPPYPYVTTAEAAYQAPQELATHLMYGGLMSLSAAATAALYAVVYSKHIGGRLYHALEHRLPFLGGLRGFIRGLPFVGEFAAAALPELLGGFIDMQVGGNFALAGLSALVEQAGEAVGGVNVVQNSLQTQLIGTKEFDYFRNSLHPQAAADLYLDLLHIGTENPLVDRETLLNVLSAGSYLGVFEFTHHDAQSIVQAVKGIAGMLRIVSEIARDPSMMDTLQRVAEFVHNGYSIQQALSLYHELGIYAQAGGTTLGAIWEQAVQQFGGLFKQVGLSVPTGVLAGVQTMAFMHGFGPYAFEEGLAPVLRMVGGAEGYQQKLLQLAATYASPNPFSYFLERGIPTTPEDFFRWSFERPQEVEAQFRKVGAVEFTLEHQARLIDQLKEMGLSNEAILYMAQTGQLPIEPVFARAYLQGGLQAYSKALFHQRIATEQARAHDIVNQMEIFSENLLYRIQKWKATLKELVQHPFAKTYAALAEELTEFRKTYYTHPEEMNVLTRFFGDLIFGRAPEFLHQEFLQKEGEIRTLEALEEGSFGEITEILKAGAENLPHLKNVEVMKEFLPLTKLTKHDIEKAHYTILNFENEEIERWLEEAYEKTHDWGEAVVEAYLQHKDEILREYGTQDVEKVKLALLEMAGEKAGDLEDVLSAFRGTVEAYAQGVSTPEEIKRYRRVLDTFYKIYKDLRDQYRILNLSWWETTYIPLSGLLGDKISPAGKVFKFAMEELGVSYDFLHKTYEHLGNVDLDKVITRALKDHDRNYLLFLNYVTADEEEAHKLYKRLPIELRQQAEAFRLYLQWAHKYVQAHPEERQGRLAEFLNYFEHLRQVLHSGKPVALAGTSEITQAEIAENLRKALGIEDRKQAAKIFKELAELPELKGEEYKKHLAEVVRELKQVHSGAAHSFAMQLQRASTPEEAGKLIAELVKSVGGIHPQASQHLTEALITQLSTHVEGATRSLREFNMHTEKAAESLEHLAASAKSVIHWFENLNHSFLPTTLKPPIQKEH